MGLSLSQGTGKGTEINIGNIGELTISIISRTCLYFKL